MAIVFVMSIGLGTASAVTSTVYDSTRSPLPPNLPSQPFQAQQTAEFGDDVQLAGTNRYVSTVTVTFSDWAKKSDWPGIGSATHWTHPITLNIYNTDLTGSDPALGSLITTRTQTVSVPFRPEADPTCVDTTQWKAADTLCYNGIAFNETFTLPHPIHVPTRIVVGIAFNTQSWGLAPTGVNGPYNSLNIGLNNVTGPSVGIDPEPDAVFWKTDTDSYYSDGGAGGHNLFRRDTVWAPYVPAFKVEAVAGCTTVCYVNGTTGDDAFSGASPAGAKKTIQGAIDQVSSNGQVRVLPGSYDETASGRGTDTDTGPYQYGLFFPPSKPGITLQGVTAADVAINDADDVAATITTNATNSFGYSGVFVSADDVSVKGLGFGQNTPASDAKTFEVIGDGFMLDASVVDSDASVYIADWDSRYNDSGTPANFADDISHIQSYTLTDNIFDGNSTPHIASGAGVSGPKSGRVITGNVLISAEPVSFAGPGAEVWLKYPVGGAVFTGNTFTNAAATRYVQAWGTTQRTAQFDWSDIFSLNTYPHPVVTTTDGNLDHIRPFTAGAFVDIYRIGAVIQNRIDFALAGDTIIAGPGTFARATIDRSLILRGTRAGVDARGRTGSESIIPVVSGGGPGGSGFNIAADDVTIDGFTIETTGAVAQAGFGIDLTSGGNRDGAHVTNTIFHNLYEGVHQPSFHTQNVLIDQNVFMDTPTDPYLKDAGVWMAAGTSNDVTITKNTFADHDNDDNGTYAAVNVDNSTNLDITDNTSTHDGSFIVMVDDTDVLVAGNTTSNMVGSTIFVGLGNDGVTIQANTLSDGFRGVRLSTAFGGPTPNQNILITKNVITDMENAGVFVDSGTISDVATVYRNSIVNSAPAAGYHAVRNTSSFMVDAICNWYGSPSSPAALISGNVDFDPWLLSSNLNGPCEADASASPTSHDFGNQTVGTTSPPFTFTITNQGVADLHITTATIAGTNPGHFAIDDNGCFNQTLAHLETCDIDMVFKPTSVGGKSAQLQVSSNDSDSPLIIGLSGTGVVGGGTIKIIQDSVPNGHKDFSFSGDLGGFILDDDPADGVRPRSMTFPVAPGTYDVTQATTANWSLLSINCNIAQPNDIPTRTVTITVGAGQTIICTFVDAKRRADALIALAAGGPYSGGNIYSATPISAQSLNQAIAAGGTKSYWMRIQNDGGAVDDFTLDATLSGSSFFGVTFWRAGVNITTAVVNGTYVVSGLPAGAQVTIEARVHAAANTAASATRNIDLLVTSNAAPTRQDLVRGHVTRS